MFWFHLDWIIFSKLFLVNNVLFTWNSNICLMYFFTLFCSKFYAEVYRELIFLTKYFVCRKFPLWFSEYSLLCLMVSLCHSSDNNLKKDYLSIKPMLERIVLSFHIAHQIHVRILKLFGIRIMMSTGLWLCEWRQVI